LFSIGSVAKVYCALAVMKLVEMKKVTLDTPIIEYLPRFTMKDERYKKITLRICLNHSSGLPGTNLRFNSMKWLDENLYDDFYDYFSKSKLKDNPGNASVYCNDGYMLVEMVIAEVSGMSYIRFIQEHITIPAGAISTCSGGNIPDNLVRIKEKGKAYEYIMNTAAGGILYPAKGYFLLRNMKTVVI
jgi:CubicO group peptidase (beta-lactamase class C family)